MSTIYVLHFQQCIYDTAELYYFSDIKNIVDFIQQQHCTVPWQTVIIVELDTNQRQTIFAIDKLGNIKPKD